jgi:hypothetical protein
MTEAALLSEIQSCRACWVFDPENQPSVLRRLDAGWEPEVWTLPNGMTLSFGGHAATVPLSSDMVLCETHSEQAWEVLA